MNRHVLIVAWWFPPRAGGGVHRPLQFARHLVRRGYRVSVLTGTLAAGDPADPTLLAKVPAAVRVVRAPLLDPFRLWAAWKRLRARAPAAAANGSAAPVRGDASWRGRLSELLTLPDRTVAWLPLAVAKAALALRGDEPDLVFSTSPPHSAQLVARALRGLFGCPLVVDLRDPWIGNPFRRYAGRWSERIDAALERAVLAEAAQVVVNTPALERAFRRRHPEFRRVRTIPNGFAPEDFEDLPPSGEPPPERKVVAHFGQLYGLRSGRYLLQGVARLKEIEPRLFAKLQLELRGANDGEAALRAQATALGIDESLTLGGPLPHREALARQRTCDVLLLLGPEERAPEIQVPGKLYEYFAAGRPILALSRRGGAIAEILAQAGVAAERAEPDDPEAIAAALARLLAGGAPRAGGAAPAAAGVEAFRYDRLTDRLEECFLDAWAGRRARAAEATARAPD